MEASAEQQPDPTTSADDAEDQAPSDTPQPEPQSDASVAEESSPGIPDGSDASVVEQSDASPPESTAAEDEPSLAERVIHKVEEILHIDHPAADPTPVPANDGWVENPLVTGSTGFVSGGGDLTPGSPALAHHIDPIAGEGEAGGESGSPNLATPGNPDGGDTEPSVSQA